MKQWIIIPCSLLKPVCFSWCYNPMLVPDLSLCHPHFAMESRHIITSHRYFWIQVVPLAGAHDSWRSHYGVTGTGSGQHTPSQCLQRELIVPSTLISTTAAVLKDTFQAQIQCTEACSLMSTLVKFLFKTAWGPRAFVSTVWDTVSHCETDNPVSKEKVNIPFLEAELQAIPHQNHSLIFVLKTLCCYHFNFSRA